MYAISKVKDIGLRLGNVLKQPEVKEHPLRAIWRRVLWRIHHSLRHGEPLVLNNWYRGMRIALPKSGSAAQVFYRQHSDVWIVRAMEERLRQGYIVLDVGAHTGEYTLVAARLVGAEGKVYAIEPQPRAADAITLNARLNGLETIRIRELAFTDSAGTMPFSRDEQSWGGFLTQDSTHTSFQVRCMTLDRFVKEEGIPHVHFMKLDAAGNEKAVLLGGCNLLNSSAAPVLVVKFYHPKVVRERFGYEARETVKLLQSWGYRMNVLTEKGKLPFSPSSCYEFFSHGTYGLPVLAWRDDE